MLKALKIENRTLAVFAVGAACGALATMAYFESIEPRTPDECLIEQLRDMQSDSAVRALGAVCSRLYPD